MRLKPSEILLLVTGSSLGAELHDRPVAYALRGRIGVELGEASESGVLVCSDLWYLNRPELADSPVVSIGGPGANALTAELVRRLEPALVVDGEIMIQWDLEGAPPRAACWGVDAERTARASLLFADRYLGAFLEAA